MKVLHVFKTYYPETEGGVHKVIENIASVSESISHRVLCVTNDPNISTEKKINIRGVEVYFLPRIFGTDRFPILNVFHKSIKRLYEWSDVVNYHYPWPVSDILSIIYNKKPYIVTYHADLVANTILDSLYGLLRMKFLKSAFRIVVTSPVYKESSSVLKKLNNTVCIPLGISADYATKEKVDIYKKYFIFVGVLRRYKGLKYLIESAVFLKDISIMIVGNGPEEKFLKKMADDHALENIIFKGFVEESEKKILINNSLGVILPSISRAEAFGVCLLEGMAHSKPLICTRIGSGMEFVNIDGVTGYVVAPESGVELAKAMQEIAENEILRNKMGTASLKRFKDKFTNDVTSAKYIELYEQAVRVGE